MGKRNKTLRNGLDFALFVGPGLLSVLVATLIPFCMNLYFSLFDWNGVSRSMEFVGFKNFVKLFTIDKQFAKDAWFTARFSILFVILVNVLAVVLALILSKPHPVANFARSCFYITNVISLVAIGFIWKFIFGPGFTSLADATGIGLFDISWLGTPRYAFYAVMLVTLWQMVGFYTIIYIAGITNISRDVLEAARIDGCTGLRHFRRITLPLIMPSVTVCVFQSLTYAFKLFDVILVLTEGGPGKATQTIAYNIYFEAFVRANYGYATAKSVVFFVAVLLITGIQLRFFKDREVEA